MSETHHGHSPYRVALEGAHQALMAALTRTNVGTDDLELGQSAQGRVYVKSLHVHREADEDTLAWIIRATDTFQGLLRRLPEAPVSPQEHAKPSDGVSPTKTLSGAPGATAKRRRGHGAAVL